MYDINNNDVISETVENYDDISNKNMPLGKEDSIRKTNNISQNNVNSKSNISSNYKYNNSSNINNSNKIIKNLNNKFKYNDSKFSLQNKFNNKLAANNPSKINIENNHFNIENNTKQIGDKELENLKQGLFSPEGSTSNVIINTHGKFNKVKDCTNTINLYNNKLINIAFNSKFAINFNSEDFVPSEKKNINYLSFKNIQERYQFKENRSNYIQMFSERLNKELTLPKINKKHNL